MERGPFPSVRGTGAMKARAGMYRTPRDPAEFWLQPHGLQLGSDLPFWSDSNSVAYAKSTRSVSLSARAGTLLLRNSATAVVSTIRLVHLGFSELHEPRQPSPKPLFEGEMISGGRIFQCWRSLSPPTAERNAYRKTVRIVMVRLVWQGRRTLRQSGIMRSQWQVYVGGCKEHPTRRTAIPSATMARNMFSRLPPTLSGKGAGLVTSLLAWKKVVTAIKRRETGQRAGFCQPRPTVFQVLAG